MKITRWRFSLRSVVLIIAVVLNLEAALSAPGQTVVSELAPGVFFRKAEIEPNFAGCNQGWIVFKDFVVVIDANIPSQAKEVIQLIRKQTDKPIRYVLDTHYHWDHADGNVHYKQEGAQVVAAESGRVLFETKGRESFEGLRQRNAEEYGELTYEIPSLFFDRKLVFDDGSQRVELICFGHGHTAGDVVAWLPKHGILFTGDACVNGAFNYMGDSDTRGWIGVLDAMASLPVKIVAPGHGEMAGRELLDTQKRYLLELRAAVQAAIRSTRTPEQITEEIDLPFYLEWTGVKVNTRIGNIQHVYRELTDRETP